MGVSSPYRSLYSGPWHFCDRCGLKRHTSDLIRQYGILACIQTCWDTHIIGDREARVARQVAVLPGQEMMPVPKVTMEDSPEAGLEKIEFGY